MGKYKPKLLFKKGCPIGLIETTITVLYIYRQTSLNLLLIYTTLTTVGTSLVTFNTIQIHHANIRTPLNIPLTKGKEI